MQTTISTEDIHRSVISVPPLCRDANFKSDAEENAKLIKHIESGGVNIMLYGGNANFYNIALSEYELVLDQLEAAASDTTIIIPAVGPYHGFMMDQAEILSRRNFPTAMLLPTMAVSKPEGVRAAIMNLVEKTGKPAVLYIKDEGYVNIEVVKSLVDAGVISWIKYAVVRDNPSNDPLLEALSKEIPNELLVSGIGEQPAIIHWQKFNVQAFTSGCVCVAPRPSQKMLEALRAGDFAKAERIREGFVPLEDLRNGRGPIQVLHEAVKLSGVANTGPHLPLLSDLDESSKSYVFDAAKSALAWNRE
ncbi:dihydrodipicolinate synthase family protein [soil metagenome]